MGGRGDMGGRGEMGGTGRDGEGQIDELVPGGKHSSIRS